MAMLMMRRLAAGIAARSRADPAFLLKLGCSCSADALVVLAVNMACRGARFWPDLEAVLSQVCVHFLHMVFCTRMSLISALLVQQPGVCVHMSACVPDASEFWFVERHHCVADGSLQKCVCCMQCCVSVLCDAALMYLAAPTAHTRRGLLRPGLPAHAFQAAAPGQAGCDYILCMPLCLLGTRGLLHSGCGCYSTRQIVEPQCVLQVHAVTTGGVRVAEGRAVCRYGVRHGLPGQRPGAGCSQLPSKVVCCSFLAVPTFRLVR